MKKNKMMRLASFLLVAVLLSTCAISGTFAKYVTTKASSDTARVAKWAFTVGGDDIVDADFTFNLFNTVTDSDGTSSETDLKATDGSIIAPGTSGKFALDLKNDSEVSAKYNIVFSAVNTASIPVEYSLDGTTWDKDVTKCNVADTDIAINGTTTVTVYWRWAFGDGSTDASDTALGVQQAAGTDTKITVSATITATQVD